MEGCVFCRIIARDMPARIVSENDSLIAIEDINPQAPVHILIIPKRHYSTLLDCGEEERGLLGDMLLMANNIAKEKGFHQRGFRVVINVNEEGGQTVFHTHMHLLAGRPLSGRLG